MKTCTRCKIPKELSNFSKNRTFTGGLNVYCRNCQSEYTAEYKLKNPNKKKESYIKNKVKIRERAKIYRQNNPDACKNTFLKKEYGITLNDFKLKLKEQNNVCAICEQPEQATYKGIKKKDLAVDHCHKTGEIRGLLCSKCNTGLGVFKESPELLNSAIKYLKKWS